MTTQAEREALVQAREAFEEWFADSRRSRGAKRRPNFNTLSDGTYADDHTQRHWWTWQTAIKTDRLAATPAGEQPVGRITGIHANFGSVDWVPYTGKPRIKIGDLVYTAPPTAAGEQAQPVANVRAKPLEWEQDGYDSQQWTDKHHGFYIMHRPEEDPGWQWFAAWGEGDEDHFDSLEEAKAWCQRQIDRWCEQWVQVNAAALAAPAPAPSAQPLTQKQIVEGYCAAPLVHQYVEAFEQGVKFAERAHGIGATHA